ncbi:MAG: hypothetical protein J1F20_02595 [Muribaculaceae bacterium]|nr:hypothetical protein [Muribaculaceae bacterium]
MEDKINEMIIIEGTTFSKGWLNVLFYGGLIGVLMTIITYVISNNYDFSTESIEVIGDILATIAEIGFISLIAYKIRKDGIKKPSYQFLACYAGILAINLLVGFINEEVGFLTSFITLIFSVVIGIIFIQAPSTKKIGMWLLLTLAAAILVIAIIPDSFELSEKSFFRILLILYAYPYGKYLESCQKYLSGNNSQDNSKDNGLLRK